MSSRETHRAATDHERVPARGVPPIGATGNHPFWSEDRQAFVPAGDLQPGERLKTADQTRLQVTRMTPRTGLPVPVFNLEIDAQHVYNVGPDGVLVHNTYLDAPATNFLYRLVNRNDETVYYGVAEGAANLIVRLKRHAKDAAKAGHFVGMQVIGSNLTRREALSLEAKLIDLGRQSGLPLLNVLPRNIKVEDMIGSTGELLRRLIQPTSSLLP